MSGRPSKYKPAVATAICERIAQGRALRSICDDADMPDRRTVLRWLARHDEFRLQYAHARELQADALFEEILEIADDGRNDYTTRMMGDAEVEVPNYDHIQRSKLRVDARKWMAAKLAPRKYGDMSSLEISGPDGGPIATVFVDEPPPETREEWLARKARERAEDAGAGG